MAGHRYAAWWGTALNVVVVVIGIYVAHIESFRRVIEVIAVVFLMALLICALVTLDVDSAAFSLPIGCVAKWRG